MYIQSDLLDLTKEQLLLTPRCCEVKGRVGGGENVCHLDVFGGRAEYKLGN